MTMGWCQSRSAILIVDDSASSRCYLSELLNGANCQVREARDGHECLAALAASTPDVVLLDVEMPGKNGIEVLQEIGLTPRFFSIILLTTRSEKEQIAAGFDLGADDYIVKPFQDVDLLARIRAAVRTSRQMRALAEARQETETAMARLKKLQYRLVEDEKIAAVARLAAGAAHHINNPLGFVMSNLATLNRYANSLLGFVGELTCELLLNAQQAEGAIRDMERAHRIVQIRKDLTPLLRETHEGTQRIALIVQQMAQLELGLAQQNMSELELVTLLQPLVGIVADLAPPGTKVRFGETTEKIAIWGALPLFNTALIAVLKNACEALGSKPGEISVAVLSHPEHAEIFISDTGPGVAQKDLDSVFEPFYTTKTPENHVGLGLTIAQSFIGYSVRRYQAQQNSTGGKRFYRFNNPKKIRRCGANRCS